MDRLMESSLDGSTARRLQDADRGPLAAAARLCEARLARLSAQKRRQLAAEHAARLEARLQEAADAGLRAEIARRLAAQRRLRAMQRVTIATQAQRRADQDWSTGPGTDAVKPAARNRFVSYAGAAAAALFLGTAVAVLAPQVRHLPQVPERGDFEKFAAQSAFAHGSPDDGLKLSLTYTMREPGPR
jgi:hypothetical protein